ncbi:putative ribonuclease H-like domain-containing protein [Tanacetum coccineum]
MAEQDIPSPTITAMKIPIIRKREYDIWSMRMRQYICHTDHNLWHVIVNGDLEKTCTNRRSSGIFSSCSKDCLIPNDAKKNHLELKGILLLAYLMIPPQVIKLLQMLNTLGGNQIKVWCLDKAYDRFQKLISLADAKSLWEAIKSRFGGNIESKKMQKNVLKHQFEKFSTASNESLDKAYDRFKKLISQLEVHGAPISKEDINQKFLRSLPSSWNQIALIMRNKPDIDEIDIDDLYNNLRNTGGNNEVSNAVENLEMDGDDLEELDLRWQVAMLTVRVKKFIQRTGRNLDFKEKRPVSLDKSGRNQGRRSYGDNGRSNAPTNESSSQALVAQDGLGGYDWSNDFKVEPVNYALMAISSSSSSSSSDRLDEYAIRNKIIESQTTELNTKTSETTSQTNAKKSKSASKSVVSNPKIDKDRVIIEDWNSDDEDEEYEVQTVRPETQTVKTRDDKSGVLTRTGLHRPSVSTARPVCTARPSVSTARPVCTAKPNGSTARPVYATRPIYPRMDNVRPRGSCSPIKRSYYTKPTFKPKDLKQDVKTFEVQNMTTAGTRAVVNTGNGKLDTDYKKSRWVWRPKGTLLGSVFQQTDHVVVDSGCSSHMTGNKAYLSDYKDFNGGFVAFGVIPGCKIMAPRKDDVYILDLKNIVPSGGITCLYANATADESKLWHRRLGYVNFKNINKLVKGHLVRGLPSKVFVNDHTCVACKKGKQHKASCKAKLERIIRKPLELLHMDLFGPVSVESINKKRYCLVVTDDFSRFSWVFFLATKDETSEILCNLIIGLENQLSHNVKIIRCDNGTEFKNHAMNELCAKKGIKREFSVARTPQQNGVAERKNRTLIEAARTMLADSLLPIPFWAEAVNTACYVLNRVLVTKPQNKTPYELLIGKSPSISFMRPFGCPLTILNTLDSLGKFDGKSDEGYLLGYSTSSKAFRVYNKRTKRVEENLHINFLEDQPNVTGTGPNWMFDLDFLTNSMNYIPVSVENQVNVDAGTQDSYVAGSSGKDKGPTQEYILLPLQPHRTRIPVEDVPLAAHEKPSESSPKENDVQDSEDAANKESEQDLQDELEKMVTQELAAKAMDDVSRQAFEEEKRRIASQKKESNTPYVSAVSTSTSANAGESSFVYLGGKIPIDASTLPNADLPIDPNMPDLEDASDTLPNDGIFNGAYDDDEDIHKGSSKRTNSRRSYISSSNKREDSKGFFSTTSLALQDESWVEAMQEELLQFKLQKMWVLVDLPYGKKVICTKWVFGNKRDEKSIVVKNKARLVAQGFIQEDGIYYDEVFTPVAIIEAIRLFLAFASYMGFTVYQMDVKSVFLYGTIKEEVYVHQPLGFVDPTHPNKVYKVIKALYGLHQAPRAWYVTLSSFLMENGFRRGTIDKTLFIKKKKSDIMLVQVYVDDIIFGSTKKSMCTEFEESDILNKFDFLSIKTATTSIESNKPLFKDEDGVDVDVHVYKSMIDSLMYLTASRPDIMFTVCACARFQVTPKASHLNAVKRIFRYLKHQPKLGLWYPRDSLLNLNLLDSDYWRAPALTENQQQVDVNFLEEEQTIVPNSTTETEYVTAANCCGQVLWIQNQMMDYGFNFKNTKIHIDNERTISVIKNPVAHSRTKHIEIRFHFIRDCYEKRLIEVIKIHTDSNVETSH